jgi:site-specific recombinase XerD
MRSDGSRLAGAPTRIKVTGPLTPWVARFRSSLTAQGFSRSVVTQHTRLLAHLSRWLFERGLSADQLTEDLVLVFVKDRRAQRPGFLVARRGLVPLLTFLVDQGAVPPLTAPTPMGPVDQLLAAYRDYLVAERGLAPLSVGRYLTTARVFLSWLPEPLDAALGQLSAGQVTTFVTAEVGRRRVWAAKSLTIALRSLLGFLHIAGHVPQPLGVVVPPVAGWGLRSLPRRVSAEVVAALLASCDRTIALGRRDYAILLVLSRLGLRNGEVARLELGDVDWQAGQILVRGKGNRHEALPLPVDVGQALVDYLQHGRPCPAGCPRLFVIDRAPYTGLSLSGVCSLVVAACDRAGVTRISPHRLRHTVASNLLARGASLAEVGQLLRHRAQSTTAIYAKLDHRSLGELARPWPGAA